MHSILEKDTLHPALHSFTTERRECDAKPGMICPILATSGSSGIANLQVCVDCTCESCGMVTLIGVVAIFISDVGASVIKKWLVAPESNIAHSLMFSILMSTVCRSAFTVYWNRGTMILGSDVGSIGPCGYCGGTDDGVGFELGVMYFSMYMVYLLSHYCPPLTVT